MTCGFPWYGRKYVKYFSCVNFPRLNDLCASYLGLQLVQMRVAPNNAPNPQTHAPWLGVMSHVQCMWQWIDNWNSYVRCLCVCARAYVCVCSACQCVCVCQRVCVCVCVCSVCQCVCARQCVCVRACVRVLHKPKSWTLASPILSPFHMFIPYHTHSWLIFLFRVVGANSTDLRCFISRPSVTSRLLAACDIFSAAWTSPCFAICLMNNEEINWSLFSALMYSSVVDWAQSTN